jgi:hypothetical protein
MRHNRALQTALLLCTVTMLATACNPSTLGPVATPTGTSTPAPSCATLLPGATAAPSPIPGFFGLIFPTGAVATALHASYGGAGQFTIQETDVCYQGTTQQVAGPFSCHCSVYANLLGTGWGFNSTYPYDGQTRKACFSGATCFTSPFPANPEHYLSFENLHSPLTGYVTYHLRLATPPPAPTCDPTNYPSSEPYTYNFGGFAVPPLTKKSNALGGGFAGGYTYSLCSAGTPATILAFMRNAVTAAGRPITQSTATSISTCVPFAPGGTPTPYFNDIVIAVATGNEWTMTIYVPVSTSC